MSVGQGHDVVGHEGPWTVEQVLALPEDKHQRIELVDGALTVSPSPGFPHQRAVYKLRNLLDRAAEEAGADVEVFSDVNIVLPCGLLIPDVVVLDAEAAAQAELTVDAEAILLVVEVISPFNRRSDLVLKPKLYAEAAIPSYWRVDLQPTACITIDEFENGRYMTRRVIRKGELVRVERPFPVDLDPAMLVLP